MPIFAVDMDKSLIELRDETIVNMYKRIVSIQGVNSAYLSRDTIVNMILENEAPRYYITPKMAERYILGWKRQSPSVLSSSKIDMIKSLAAAYDAAKLRHPNANQGWLWQYVVQQHAPSFFMTKNRIYEIIFNRKYRGNGKNKRF